MPSSSSLICRYRCVVMVGLPYPNITSPELKEKMEYLNSTMVWNSIIPDISSSPPVLTSPPPPPPLLSPRLISLAVSLRGRPITRVCA